MPESDARRKVVKANVDRHGDAIEIDTSVVDPLVLSIERTRRWLVGIVIVLAAVLIGIAAALINSLSPDAIKTPSSGVADSGPMVWEQSIYGIGPTAGELFIAPTSVAVGPTSDIYVAEPQRSRVLVFSPAGVYERTISPLSEETTGTPVMSRPESVFVDENGNLYVADPVEHTVFVFNAGDELMKSFLLDDEARGVAVEGDLLYVLGQGRVYVLDIVTGEEIRWFGSFGSFKGEIDAYQGIAVKDGIVYIADSFNKRIEAFSSEGDLLWENDGITGSDSAGVWQLPQDLTIDAAGRLVVVDALNFELIAARADSGEAVDEWGDFGSRDGKFSYPSSVAYDSVRDRFVVADTKNNRVQIVTLPGSTSAVDSLVKRATLSPWRYLTIPIIAVLAALLLWIVIRTIRRRRHRRR